MFRETTTQSSLFEVQNVFPGILPEDDWSHLYRASVFPLIDEQKFKHLFEEEGGRPNTSINRAVSILIFMGMEKHNWRGGEFQFRRRLDWQNATCTPLGEACIDHTTLFKFYQKLEKDDSAMKLFQELTLCFAEACGTTLKKQRTDSFLMQGWLQVLSRYGLFKETIRKFLQSLRKQKPGLYETIKGELSRDYLEQEFDLTEKDREKVIRQVKKLAKDLYVLYKIFENHRQVKHYESFKTLSTVLVQQCEIIEEDSDSVKIEIREKPLGDEIISTPHNTDARYVKKGNQKVCGHRGFVTETCDDTNQTQFITDVGLTPANSADVEELPKIEARLEESGLKPEKMYGDAGFVNGKTILDAKEKGISLEGPSSGRSQSFEAFADKDRPLDVADFDVSIEAESQELVVNACPNNQIPIDQSRSEKTGKMLIHFDPAECSSCSLKERCPTKIGVRVATMTIDEASYAGALRHHQYMENKDYRKECSIRAGAEALVSEMVRAHGVRKSRHRTETRTKLQMIFSAMACNVKRFIKHGVEYSYVVPVVA